MNFAPFYVSEGIGELHANKRRFQIVADLEKRHKIDAWTK